MAEHSGWILDLYEDAGEGVVLWLLADDGTRLRLHRPFPVTFYVGGEEAALHALERWLKGQPVPLQLGRAERFDVFLGRQVPVLSVQVQRPTDQPALFRQVSRQFPALSYADADIPIALRFAAAHGVGILGRCSVEAAGALLQSVTPLGASPDAGAEDLPLRILRLTPDCDPAHGTPRALEVRSGKHACLLDLDPARPLLLNLQAILRRTDPDLLLTRWGDTWLLPWLLGQSRRQGLLLPLSRDASRQPVFFRERSYFSYGQVVHRGQQVHLFGRWHIDCRNAMLWDDYDLQGALETARITCMPVQMASRLSPGSGISAVQILTALRQRTLVPWQKQQTEKVKPVAALFSADQGGLVYQPPPGVYRDVAELDFVSMYPAIMVRFNLSAETVGVDGPSTPVPGLDFGVLKAPPGIVPQSLLPLLERRVALKRRASSLPRWDPRRETCRRQAAALKWLLVTCFGYLGYKNARFGRIEAHQAVTAYGREALLRAKEAAEDFGFEVLHMYVDALWVRQPGRNTPADLQPLLEEIQQRTGLPLGLEGIYRWLAFLPSRVDGRRPVASRYFGAFQDGSLKIRGIEARRRDTPTWIARCQLELLNLLASAPDPRLALPAALVCLRRQLADLRQGRPPAEELVVRQKLTRRPEEYRTPSASARAAMQLQAAGRRVRPGQRISLLITAGKPGVFAWDMPHPPRLPALDLDRYEVLLLRAASSVLGPFGWDEQSLRASLHGGLQAGIFPGFSNLPPLPSSPVAQPGAFPRPYNAHPVLPN